MKVLKVGRLEWAPGILSLDEWEFDLEGMDYTGRQLQRACTKCAIKCMMDNVGVDIEDAPDFYVERLASDVIFHAQVTSSPAMLAAMLPWHRRAWIRVRSLWQ